MRGLIKGTPPINVSPPTQQPLSLADWDANYRTSLAAIADPQARVVHARTRWNSMHKRSLRDRILVEQRYLCIFCERPIDEAVPPPPVDHWNPLSQFLDDVFNWNNLHLSCRTVDTCDDRKKDHKLDLPWPVDFKYEEVLGFTSGGLMYVRSDTPLEPELRQALAVALEDQPGPPAVRSTLNLNQPALRAAREAAIEAEEGTSQTPAQRPQRVADLLTQQRGEEFISARLAFLNGQLGVGR